MWFVTLVNDEGNTVFYGQSHSIQDVKNWTDELLNDDAPFDGYKLTVSYDSDLETLTEGVFDNR